MEFNKVEDTIINRTDEDPDGDQFERFTGGGYEVCIFTHKDQTDHIPYIQVNRLSQTRPGISEKQAQFTPVIYPKHEHQSRKVSGFSVQTTSYGDLELDELHLFIEEMKHAQAVARALSMQFVGHLDRRSYTTEYCPWCDTEQVIYARGVTACPSCGKPMAPCSVCHDELNGECPNECPYGCKGTAGDENKSITNPPITEAEIKWFHSNE